MGRVGGTLQRFTSDEVKVANISFYSEDLNTVSYRVDLEKVIIEQFESLTKNENNPSIAVIDIKPKQGPKKRKLSLGVSALTLPIASNPDLPLSLETGRGCSYRLCLAKIGSCPQVSIN